MHRKVISTAPALIAAAAICILGDQIAGAQQQPITRTDLLKTYLDQMEDKQMQVWVADIPPGLQPGRIFIRHQGSSMFSKALSFSNPTANHRRLTG
jgi:hypothetical protein